MDPDASAGQISSRDRRTERTERRSSYPMRHSSDIRASRFRLTRFGSFPASIPAGHASAFPFDELNAMAGCPAIRAGRYWTSFLHRRDLLLVTASFTLVVLHSLPTRFSLTCTFAATGALSCPVKLDAAQWSILSGEILRH
jgi:hypothetical protein